MEHRRHRATEYRDPSGYAPEETPYGEQYYDTNEYSESRPRRQSPHETAYRSEYPSSYGRSSAESRRGSAETTPRRRPTGSREASAEHAPRRRPAGSREASAEHAPRRRPTGSREASAEHAPRRRSTGNREEYPTASRQNKSAAGRGGTSGGRRSSETTKGTEKSTHSTVRSERSIKAAKERQAIRAENARLHRLRRQQKRKAKRRIVKRIDKGLFKRLMIMGGVILAVILSMVIFFRVETIQVIGSTYYSEKEILEACGVATGDNLLTLSRGKISGSIMAPLKYVDSVKVSRQLPNILIISVTESKPRYAVQDTDGNYFLMTAQGKIMEQITQSSAKEFTIVEELLICPPAIGEDIQIAAEEGAETKAKGQFAAVQTVLTAIEEAALGRHIASVRIPSSYKISLWYEDRFQVELGNTTKIDYKLEYLKAVIDKEESYVTGTIDLTFRDGEKAILLREQ